MRIGVLHGPNLNLLGAREDTHYGGRSLEEIEAMLRERALKLAVEVVSVQSNHEGELIDWVQQRSPEVSGWLINAGGYTHTSVALRDALVASRRPFVEVHLSNVLAREPFRRRSLLADRAVGVIAGFRANSYLLGLTALVEHLRANG
ncbi:MAG: type II 3-dehydroquinate dehydratase [Gemmatimonadota bacterium]